MTYKQITLIISCLVLSLPFLLLNKAHAQCKEFSVAELQEMCSYTRSELVNNFSKNGYQLLNQDDIDHLAFVCPTTYEQGFLIHTAANSVCLMERSKIYTDNLIKKFEARGYKFISKDYDLLLYKTENFILTAIKDTADHKYSIYLNKRNNVPAERLSNNKVAVNSYTNYSDISVKKGDKVYLHVSGSIVTGAFSGSTGPGGKKWVATWNIKPDINYGALLIGVSFGGDWKPTGENAVFTADATGKLTFRINDTDPSDNDGAFIVEYSINKPLPYLQSTSPEKTPLSNPAPPGKSGDQNLPDAYYEGRYGKTQKSINSITGKNISVTGHWTMQHTSWDFSYSMDLKVNAQHTVTGTITWTINKIDRSGYDEYRGKLNKSGKEYVVGTLNSNTIEIHGVSKDDPFNVIGLDSYEVNLSDNNEHHGKTKTNGTWQGILGGTYSISSIGE